MVIRETILQVFIIRIIIVLSSPPLINNKIGDVFIDFCQVREIPIYLDQYSDGITTNGKSYNLTLLDSQYIPVKPNSKYVQYSSSLQKLFFVPQSFLQNSTKQDLFYTIQIKNANGAISNDSFKVSMSGKIPEQRYVVAAKVKISNPNLYTTDVEKLYSLLAKIHNYFNKFYVSRFLYLVDYTIVGEVMIINFQDCSFNQGEKSCNRKNKYALKSQLCTDGFKIEDICVPRQILYQQLSPEFQLLDFKFSSFNLKPYCIRKTQPKTTREAGADLIDVEFDAIPGLLNFTFPIPFYELTETTSPDDVFDLVVFNKPKGILEFVQVTYWAYVYNQKDSHQIYITMTDEARIYSNVTILIFDYEFLSAEAYVIQLPKSKKLLYYYYVEFLFSSFNTQNLNIWSYHMQYFVNSLIDVFGRNTFRSKIYLRWFYLNGSEFATKKDTSGYLAWGIDFREVCDFTLIQAIQKIMFSNLNLLIINPKFQQSMSNVLNLTSIKETYDGKCKLNPPVLKNVIPMLQFSYCGVNKFQIPQNTFMDIEDGDTRNLKLTLLGENSQVLTLNSWIQFNVSTQTIVGLASKSIISKSYTFILLVTDSSNLSISSYINILLNESVADETFFITMKGFFIPLNLNVAYTTWSYIDKWLYNYGYILNDFRLLQNSITSLNENYFLFTSCSFRTQPCDALKIKKYKDFFFENNLSVKPDFLAFLSPLFSNLKIFSDVAGACQINNPPVIVKSWGPLYVSTCETFAMAVPMETFNDIEQGNTRFLYLTLNTFEGTMVPEWILFSSENQTLTIVTYSLLKDTSFNYQLKATDLSGQSVIQTLNIVIIKSLKEPSLLVSMNFSSKLQQASDFVTVYKSLRNIILSYFGDTKSTLEYIGLSSYPSSIYSIQWTNCTISRDVCEMDKYKFVEERIKLPVFLSYLNLNFVILNISIAMNGICRYINTPPKVMYTIPIQSVNYCWYLRYLIPENTFIDSIDGGTRNLTLSMTQSDGSVLNSNSIVSFNSGTQEVSILITSFPTKSQSNIFSINAKTKRGLSVTTPFIISIIGQPVVLKSFIQFVVVSNLFKNSEPNTNAYIMFLDLFNTVYQFNPQSTHPYEIINGNSFVSIKMVTCGIQSCSGAIDQRRLNQRRYNLTGFEPNFSIEQIEYKRDSSCQGQPPVVVQPLKQFVAKTCETFSYNISKQAFQDPDGSENLIYIITQINGEYTAPSSSWVTIEGMTITGIVQYTILLNQPNGLFNITIRAVNSYQLFTEAIVMMVVEGPIPQIFYKYLMTCNIIGSLAQSNLRNQIIVTNTINKFFNNRTVNILSYSNLVNGGFKIEWSVCLLPRFCTESGLKEYSAKIYNLGQASLGVSNFLLNLFSSVSLKLLSIDEVVLKQYMPPFNYPTSKVSIYDISVDYCGGFRHLIDENLFLDVEDGNTRSLKLRLMASEKDYASTLYSWIILNQRQEIQGMPTYADAKSNYTFQLYAQDSCGLETSIRIVLQFKQPINFQQPAYIYRFIFSSVIIPDVSTRFMFMDTLAKYLGDSNRSNIGFSQFNQNMIFYYNCSVSYSPCDIYKLDVIYNKLATSNSVARPSLIDAFAPNFILTLVVKQLENCKGPLPPIVVDPPPKIIVWLCGVFTYYIPEKTFYDYEQGYTQNLNLNLQSSSYVSSLIQFSSSSQSISILPTASLSSSTSYIFNIVATNKAQLSSLASLVLQLQGPFSLFRECQIKMLLVKGISRHSSVYEAATFIVGKLAIYFSIKIDEIVVVDLQDSTDSIAFSWSFCSKNYQSYVNDSEYHSVDYIAFQQKILMRLFYEDRVTFNAEIKNAFESYFTVSTVTTYFTKRCANFPPISLKDEITIIISYGGYYFHTYQNNYFYDFKDGGAFNLRISLLTLKGSAVQLDSWVNVDITTRRIIAVVYDTIRNDILQKYQFFLTAINSIGLTSQISVVIMKDNITYNQVVPFYIRYYFSYAGSSDSVYVNQSAYIVDSILRYFTSITSRLFILVKYFLKAYGYLEYRVMEWTVAFHTCDSIVLKTVKEMYTNQGALENLFISSMNGNTNYKFAQINFASTCYSPPSPPLPINPISPPNIDFCSVYNFRLPSDLFIDSEGSQHLALSLLDSNYKKVSASSWIQINSATQELFAISILSLFKVQSSYRYFIQATNSANLTAFSGFNFTMNNYPYTSDCKISVTFNYKYVVEDLVELDILRLFIEKTSSYYGDAKVNSIKIIQFQKLSSSYQVVWSNCSFLFSSQIEASQGLTESYRSQISTIFSKIVLVNGEVNPSYRSHMSNYFEILGVIGNYDCIEEPPVPNGNYIENAEFCSLFYKRIDSMAFYDKRDGNTRFLKLSLVYQNGNKVSPDHWVQLNDDQYVYGVLTPQVVQKATVYQYFVVATDSSGRTANVSYKILTSTKYIDFDPYFRTGFDVMKVDMSTAFILFTFVSNLSLYLSSNDKLGQIYIKSFEYPSTIVWTHCSLLICTQQNVENIITKLVTTQNKPVSQFTAAMQPYIIPYSTQFCLGSCGRTGVGDTIIISPPIINVNECGFWKFYVPSNAFQDPLGYFDSKYFCLDLLYVNGSSIQKSSWLQFNGPLQMFYGVATISQMSSVQKYLLTSVNQLTNSFKSSEWSFDYTLFESLQKYGTELCLFEFLLRSEYNSDYNDVNIVFLFMATLSAYLKSDSNTIQIYSFQRYSGYPYNFRIIWTNCTYTASFIEYPSNFYYASISNFLAQITTFKNNIYGVNEMIYKYFKENSRFIILSVSINEKCFPPPNNPPRSKYKDLSLYPGCGKFKYLIPEDVFYDVEDGNTRNLRLLLKKANGSMLDASDWLFLNKSQYIKGLLFSNETVLLRTKYEFLLEAFDSYGSRASLKIVVFMPKNSLPNPKYAAHIMFTTIVPTNILVYMQILEKIEYWAVKFHNIENPNFFLYGLEPYLIRFSHCDICGKKDIDTLLRAFSDYEYDFGYGHVIFKKELDAVFNSLLEIESISSEVIDNYCDVLAPSSMFIIPLKACSLWSFDLVINETLSLYNYDVNFTGPNGTQLTPTDFMWLNKYVLEAYPKESFWKSEHNYTYEYRLINKNTLDVKMNDKNMTYVRTLVFQSVIAYLDLNYLQYIVTVQTPTVMDQVDNFYISLVLTAVRNKVGSKTGSNIHFLRYEKSAFNLYRVYWLHCSITNDCTSSNYFKVHKEISYLTLPLGYQVTILINNCKNTAISGPAINLIIPACGLFKYKLNFSLTNPPGTIIKLTQLDGSDLPLDSWIRLNAASGEIYALPTETVVQLKQVKKYLLQLLNDFVTLINVTVEIKNDRDKNYGDSYYSVTAGFQSYMSPQTPILDIEVKFLELVAGYSRRKLLDFRVLSIRYENYIYYLKYAYCSVPKMLCENDKKTLLQNEAKIMTGDREPTKNFSAYIVDFFSINIIFYDFSLIMVEVPPVVKKALPPVLLYACQPQCIDICSLFYEASDQRSLVYTFYFDDNSIVPNSYWAQLANQSICFYPTPSVTQGVYRFKLKATNNCNSLAQIDVTAYIRSSYEQNFGYEWSMEVNILKFDNSRNVSQSYNTDVSIIKSVYEPLVQYLCNSTGALQQIQLLYYRINANILTLKVADCSMCNDQTVTSLTNTLFSQPGVVRDNLKKVIDVVKANSDTKCNPKLPKCNVTNIHFQTPICQLFKFKFDDNLCVDYAKNDMRSLITTFYVANLETERLPVTSWLQYNNQTRTIYGYPKHIGYTYTNKYFLKIADSDGNQALIEIYITIHGTPDLDYQLTISGYILDTSIIPSLQEMCLIEKIASYFNSPVNSIYFQINPKNMFDFTWSFCKNMTNSCNCSEIAQTQQLIKRNTFAEVLSSCVTINNKAYTLYGLCKSTQGPQVINSISEILITPGNFYKVNLPKNHFIATEDSGNLSFYLVKTDNVNWLQLYGNSVCGLIGYLNYIELGYKRETVKEYSIAAEDSCGKITYDQFRVKFFENFVQNNHLIYILLDISYYQLIGNCSYLGGLIQLLANTAGVTTNDIVVNNILESNNTRNGTIIEFYSRIYSTKSCNDTELITYVEKFYKDEKGNEVFIRYLEKSGYKVDIVNRQILFSCQINPTMPPPPPPPTPPYWLIIILIVVLLLLVFWLLWFFIPRCCPSCCSRFCSCCDPCCQRGGKCASLSEDGKTCYDTCCGGNPQMRKSSSSNSVRKLPGFSSVSPPISRKSSDTSEYHIKVEPSDHTDWPDPKLKRPSIVDKITQTSDDSPPTNKILSKPYLPSSLPSLFQTQSWHDDRNNIYKRKIIYQDDDVRDDNANSYQHSLNEEFSNREQSYFDSARKHSFFSDRQTDRNRDYNDQKYNEEPFDYMPSVPSKQEVVRYKENRRPSYRNPEEHLQLVRYNSGRTRRRSSLKHPITIKVRRSELKKYLGSGDSDKIKLQSGDIRRLLRGNAKVKLLTERDYDNYSGKTSRGLSVKRRLSYGNRNLSFSTTSLSDEPYLGKSIQRLPSSTNSSYEFYDRSRRYSNRPRRYSDSSVNDYELEQRNASISPRKIFLTLDGEKSPRFDDPNSRLTLRKDSFIRKRSHQQNNYVFKDQSLKNIRRDSNEMTLLSNGSRVNKTYLEDSYI